MQLISQNKEADAIDDNHSYNHSCRGSQGCAGEGGSVCITSAIKLQRHKTVKQKKNNRHRNPNKKPTARVCRARRQRLEEYEKGRGRAVACCEIET